MASNQTNFGVMGTASTTAQKEFAYLGQLLWNAYAAAPPSALSAVYQAIATIPGVTVNQGLRDAAGSPAVGITDDGGATEILLNPQTYQVVGINLTWVVPSKAQQVKKVGRSPSRRGRTRTRSPTCASPRSAAQASAERRMPTVLVPGGNPATSSPADARIAAGVSFCINARGL